jgi:hypothetical protein
VGGGRHLATLAARGGFALFVGVAVGALLFVLHPRLRRVLAERPFVFVSGALGLIVALELVNRFVLVRLYPSFHVALAATALTLGPLALLPFAGRLERGAGGLRGLSFDAAVLGLTLGLVLLVPASARRLARFDNYRLLLLESAPIAREGVELAARIAPPAPWETPTA